MSRPTPALLDKIAMTKRYRRRCNGQPAEGILIGGAELCAVLASSTAVTVGAGGVITWRADGRGFSAEPVRDEPAK